MTDHTARPSGAALLQKLSAIPPLQFPGVVVYLISRRNAQNVATQLHELLDSDEKARSTRLSTWEQRSRFVTGRVALRCALTILEGGMVPEPDWRFGASTNGKPYIQAPKSSIRSFNISYASGLIAIGISREVDVGVDIEICHEIPQRDFPWHLFSVGGTTPSAGDHGCGTPSCVPAPLDAEGGDREAHGPGFCSRIQRDRHHSVDRQRWVGVGRRSVESGLPLVPHQPEGSRDGRLPIGLHGASSPGKRTYLAPVRKPPLTRRRRRLAAARPTAFVDQIALAGLPCQIESVSTVSPFITKESAARMTLSPVVTP